MGTFIKTVDFEKVVQHLVGGVAHRETLVCSNKPQADLACNLAKQDLGLGLRFGVQLQSR